MAAVTLAVDIADVWPVVGKSAATVLAAYATAGPYLLLTMDSGPGPLGVMLCAGMFAGACWLIWGVA